MIKTESYSLVDFVVLVPEAISVPDSEKLVSDDGSEGGTWSLCSGLENATDPQINVRCVVVV